MIGGMLALAGGVAEWRRPKVTNPIIEKETFLSWIPDQAKTWQSLGAGDVVLPPPDELSDRLYDNLVTRIYQNAEGEEVMLLLAYNNRQDGMLQVHRPEVCYPVGGFTLSETRPTDLGLGKNRIPSSEFTASSPGRTEHVVYFTRVGQAFPRTWSQQRVAVVDENLRGSIPDGMMMRVSSLSPDFAAARQTMERFSASFFNTSATQLQKLLIGTSQEIA